MKNKVVGFGKVTTSLTIYERSGILQPRLDSSAVSLNSSVSYNRHLCKNVQTGLF